MEENASLGVHLPATFMPTSRPLRPDSGADAAARRGAASRVRLAGVGLWMREAWRDGLFLLLWPAWWALWLAAGGFPPWRALLLFTLAPWLVHGFGGVFGNAVDRWLDRHRRDAVPPPARAGNRRRDALAGFAGLALVALALAFLANRLALYLGAVALVLALIHPFVQRATYLSQVFLGVAFSWGIPMAFATVQGSVPPLGLLLLCASALWASGGCIWRAMADREEDLRRGVRSTAILLGDMDLAAQALLFGGALVALMLVGQRAELGAAYFAGLGVSALLIGRQLWIARGRERAACLRAFALGGWVGAAVFAGLVAGLALKGA
jgi:4-hydroxybenzoate polyprenyltransferase